MEEKIITYKAFDKDMKCRGFQYEIGKTYIHDGDVKACSSGFHACEYPLDIFNYYNPGDSVFAIVEQSGSVSKHGNDSKIASSKITIKASLDLQGIIKAAVDFTFSKVKLSKKHSNSDDYGAASNSGNYGVASNSGYQGAASNSGNYGAASNSGNYGAASNSGNRGAASNSGYQGAASNSGYQGAASNSGNYGAASNSGHRGVASNSGDYGVASNSGNQGAASNSGYHGVASNSGTQGVASNSGYQGVASAFGYKGKAKSSNSGAIVLCYRNDYGKLIYIKASMVGENGIKPDTWYSLDEDGNFVEA